MGRVGVSKIKNMITLFKYRPFNDHLKSVIMSQKIWFPTRAKLNDPEDLELNLVEDVDAEVYHQFLLKKADQESWPRKHLKYNLKKSFTAKGDLTSQAKRKIVSSKAMLQKHFDGLGCQGPSYFTPSGLTGIHPPWWVEGLWI